MTERSENEVRVPPVLVVGSPRTGTTALALALNAAGIFGFSEGHFLRLFLHIEKEIVRYYADEAKDNVPGTLLHHLPLPKIIGEYRNLAVSVAERAHGNKPWFDKTAHGGMIGSLPFFKSLWPEAKIIFAKRRPIENLQSRLKKFPNMSFLDHCRDLKYIFMTWANVRDQIDKWIELDQYDLINAPEQVTESISQLLNFNSGSRDAFYTTISNTYPEKSSSSYLPLKFSDLDWPEENKASFSEQLDCVMQTFGYGYEEYYANGPMSYESRAAEDKTGSV